jgi:hypothetical protein
MRPRFHPHDFTKICRFDLIFSLLKTIRNPVYDRSFRNGHPQSKSVRATYTVMVTQIKPKISYVNIYIYTVIIAFLERDRELFTTIYVPERS